MVQKRMIITGIIDMGDFARIILYPNEVVKKKKMFNFTELALSGDIEEMQKKQIVDAMLSNNPASLIVTQEESRKLDRGMVVNITIEVET